MSIKDYQTAIDLLMTGNLNYEKIVIGLAKQHPKMFLKIVTQPRDLFTILAKDQWMTEVRSLLANGQKVDGIKLIRDHTGRGLKESKDIADFALHIMEPMSCMKPLPLPTTDENLARQIAA